MTRWQFRNITEIVAPLWDPRQGHVYKVLNTNDFLFLSFPLLLLPATNQHFFKNPATVKNETQQPKITLHRIC